MPNRRIIAIWFPYMGAERILRKTQHNLREPIVVVANKSQSEIITSLCSVAQSKGILLDSLCVMQALFAQIYS